MYPCSKQQAKCSHRIIPRKWLQYVPPQRWTDIDRLGQKGRCEKCRICKQKDPKPLRFRVFLARREGFEPPAFRSVGCLKHKSEPFRLRFVLFTAVRSVDFPLFPSRPACSGSVLGQKWVKISSQAVFKAGMSSTKVSHTEGMSIEPYHKVREKKKIFLKPRTMWYDL